MGVGADCPHCPHAAFHRVRMLSIVRGMDAIHCEPDGHFSGLLYTLASDPRRQRSAMTMLLSAIRNGWPIPAPIRQHAPALVAAIMVDESASTRHRLRAAELLAAMAGATGHG